MIYYVFNYGYFMFFWTLTFMVESTGISASMLFFLWGSGDSVICEDPSKLYNWSPIHTYKTPL